MALFILVLFIAPFLSQTASSKKPSFEVISVKPSPPGPTGPRGIIGPRGDRFNMPGAALRMLLQYAYRSALPTANLNQSNQIIGAPGWIDTDRFDVEAKADCSTGPINGDQMSLMLQSLLEERFQLKAHIEARELPIYHLVVGKDGPKMKLSADQSSPRISQGPPPPVLCGPAPGADVPRSIPPFDPNRLLPPGGMRISGNPTGTTITASGIPISSLVGVLQGSAGRPVLDKTDLKGLFDFSLQYTNENLPGIATPFGAIQNPAGLTAPPTPGTAPAPDLYPSLFTAIQEQLGLRLESTKGPVNVLVIDSVQKPMEQ